MSLVAYESNSESENETEEAPGNQAMVNNVPPSPVIHHIVRPWLHNPRDVLVINLPQPKPQSSSVVEEQQDEFLTKKEQPAEKPEKVKQPVKIGISAMSDFNSDGEDEAGEPAKKKLKEKATGLFSLLPPPKGTPLSSTSFVPNVLQVKGKAKNMNAKKVSKVSPKTKPPLAKPNPSNTAASAVNGDYSDDDIEVPETFDDKTWQEICGKQKQKPKSAAVPEVPVIDQEPAYNVELAPAVEQPYTGLDNQAFKELVGNAKRQKTNIKLIDIHEDEIRPDKEEWLKSLTDPNFEPNPVVKEVDNTRKIKNHITSLAQKALANDKELQMRWAESRHNRRQTQAKYGF